jgi:polar amino acid transport system substrate-binding protein/glutamate/aspartate transport system substrate-binding protein
MTSQPSWRFGLFAAVLLATPVQASSAANAGAVDQIKSSQTIRVAYRDDAAPFSSKGANDAEPSGYMVNLCRGVAKKLAGQFGLANLKVTFVPVTAANRFDAIKNGQADLLCEATSATLARRAQVDFSIATFIDGASVLTTDDTIRDLKGLDGKTVGVLAGSTTENALRGGLKTAGVTGEIVPVKTHAEGLAMLDDGKLTAYFADRSILLSLVKSSKAPTKLSIARDYLTIEPYALALPRGDEDFRLAVDTALSHIYLSPEIRTIFEQSFGESTKPSETIKMIYVMSALPD